MNTPNTDPLPEQPGIVAPFLSPSALYAKQAAAPSVPFALANAVPQPPDNVPSPPSPDPEPDPDWSVSPLPKLPPFIERLPDNITLGKVTSDFGLDLSTFNGTAYRCPFHDDKNPSLKLNQPDSKNGWFYCFGCHAAGDLIHWVALHTKQSKLAAYMMIRQFYGLSADQMLHASNPRHFRGKVRIGGRRTPTLGELEALAASGSWDLTALRILAARDQLQVVARYSRHQAYVLLDPYYRVAVLRRMDGGLWNGTHKALLAKGSNLGVPIGVHQIEGFDYLALCEGGPDYFRLLSLITEAGRTDWVLPLLMPSAAAKTFKPYLIGSFRNKRIRIFAHNDQPGIAAARAWKDQLQAARAEVDVWIPPRIALPDSQATTDLQDLYFKLSPHSRAEVKELKDLLNFNVVLFEPRL
jgi:hypothetical protein